MAKTKKEKIVDLKPEKVNEEQLKKIQDIINVLNKAQLELGMIETRKHAMLHSIAREQDQLTLLQNELEKEYGTIDININDGTINYPKNGETDKKD